MINNPVLKVFDDSEMVSDYVPLNKGITCFVNTTSKVPFKSYDKSIILLEMEKRFNIIENEEEADVICASENESLYKAAYLGKYTILVGESEVYKKLFPANEILN